MVPGKSIGYVNMVRNKSNWFGGCLALLLWLGQLNAWAQRPQKYLVLLKDKANSPFSVSRPQQFLSPRSIQRRQKQNIATLERDLPVNPAYLTQIQQAGAKIWFPSRWLNAVLIEATDAVLDGVKKLPFVTGIEFNKSLANARVGAITETAQGAGTSKFGAALPLYGNSLAQVQQLGVDKMHDAGYHGEGMLIGVLDAGFLNANTVGFLKPLFDEKRVLATYDFVQKETSVYEDDAHGMQCLSTIAATADNQLYGTAYKAQFILLRTEDARTEQRVEEANWLFGAEYADSAGVDVISSSLGYTTFDDPTSNYTYADMNGKTTLSARAAQIASETGMVIVVAAGNDGASAWRYISTPSDAAGVLSIAAVDQTGKRASFSSIGPAPDGRVKPDLAARGQGTTIGNPNGLISSGNGTSFATPLMAGLAGGFWQANPQLTAVQVTDALRKTGSQYATPDAQLGYGIPKFTRLLVLANNEPISPPIVFPNPVSDAGPLLVRWPNAGRTAPIDAILTDLTGRVYYQKQYAPGGADTFTLPTTGLATGLYFVTLTAGNLRETVKVIKQ
ncbi:MAG: S8 family serine peptidase [Spirosoma sp.]|nr:S8 family serine peptidase [Spirosoma sp.]